MLMYVSTCVTTGCIGDLAINLYILFCYDPFPYDYNWFFRFMYYRFSRTFVCIIEVPSSDYVIMVFP
jgi:hypothetical protein